MKHCTCGAELVGSVNDFRGLCDRCILHKTMSGHVWNEDPDAARAHHAQWLRDRGCVCTVGVELDDSCPVHFPDGVGFRQRPLEPVDSRKVKFSAPRPPDDSGQLELELGAG